MNEVRQANIVVQGDAHARSHGVGAHQLLTDHHVEPEVGCPASTVIFGHRHTEETRLARLAEHVLVDLALGLPFGDVGGHLAFDELADGGAE